MEIKMIKRTSKPSNIVIREMNVTNCVQCVFRICMPYKFKSKFNNKVMLIG